MNYKILIGIVVLGVLGIYFGAHMGAKAGYQDADRAWFEQE